MGDSDTSSRAARRARRTHACVERACGYSASLRRSEYLGYFALAISMMGIVVSIMLVTLHVGSEARTAKRITTSNAAILERLQSLPLPPLSLPSPGPIAP